MIIFISCYHIMVNFRRRYRGRKSAHGHASTIQRAWRRRKRRKTGLVSRTVLANRKTIQKLNKRPEIKVIEDHEAVAAPPAPGVPWMGQFFRLTANRDGQTTLPTTDAVVKPLYLGNPTVGGAGGATALSNQRIGDWVTLRSLTYKVQVDAETGVTAANFNRVGMLIVLDRDPTSPTPNLNGVVSNDTGTLLDGQSLEAYLKFPKKENCIGKEARYKILKHHRGIVQPQAAGANRMPNLVWTGVIKAPYKLQYNGNNQPKLPRNQNILMFFYSDSATFPAPQFTGYCRYRFTDS